MSKQQFYMSFAIVWFAGIVMSCNSMAQSLVLHYGLSSDVAGSKSVIDETGNAYNGSLLNGAQISSYNGIPVIDLGSTNGYVDLGTNTGNLISTLKNFTIVCKVFIPTTTTLSSNGNFIWTFANSNNLGADANGGLFFSARNCRYAISLTNYTNESGIETGNALTSGQWKVIVYVEKDGLGRLFIDGNIVKTGQINLTPSELGATFYNYLGRSCYNGDAYLKDAKLADFRIYNGALPTDQIEALSGVTSQFSDVRLLVKYNFDKVADTSDKYFGSLHNGAELSNYAGIPVLKLGSENGYFDFEESFGEIIARLDSFTISTNIMVPNTTNISQNGNFVWTFANSDNMGTDANGNMFLSSISTRYAISKTNYGAESAVNVSRALTKGKWINLTYTQINGKGRIYIDGIMLGKNNVSLTPSVLDSTTHNYLGKSCYLGDAYLKNAVYHKFRIYEGAMSEALIGELCSDLTPLNNYLDSIRIAEAMNELVIVNTDSVRSRIPLQKSTGDGVSVKWSSSNTDVVTNDGEITRPAIGENPVKVTLTATLSYNNVSITKIFEVTILPGYTDQESAEFDLRNITIGGNVNNARSFIILPVITIEGSRIEWTSGSPDYMNNIGRVIKQPPVGSGKKTIILTAKVTKGESTLSKDFEVKIAEEEDKSAYLFVYFTGNEQANEQIRYAISKDGYNYTPLNNGNPVIGSDTISIKKAVRDPHILRCEDGKTFYMVATDMKSGEGWTSNRGIVLLKSTDLVNWTHAAVNFPTKWPEKWSNVLRVWAPETVYDPGTGKYMVYFSLLTSDGTCPFDQIYYSYANSDFTDLEGEPVFLFDRGSATIDGDIIFNETDSLYHLYFKNEGTGSISKVTSNTLTPAVGQPNGSQWSQPSDKLQQTDRGVEGVGLFRLINSDYWVMMYDVFNDGYYQYCVSSDLNNFKYVSDNSTLHARHGTTIAITDEEADRLIEKFPGTALSNIPKGASDINIRQDELVINHIAKVIDIPVRYGVDLSNYDPLLFASHGADVKPTVPQDFSDKIINYSFTLNGATVNYRVRVYIAVNPIIPDFHADPEILFSEKTKRYYIYPTTDGYPGWGGYFFDVFSSPDLVNWTNEGTILDLSSSQVSWATGNAWAPCIEEKKAGDEYKYYFYFSGESGGKKIGVAIADDPTGPFVDMGTPLISDLPQGVGGGQQIDVDVFTDPETGKSYIYWGNGYMAVAELNEDMVSLKPGTTIVLTPAGRSLSTYAYREGTYVFYREGKYYFLWSVDDTGSPNYHVAYGTSDSPTGPITVAANPIVIIQIPEEGIYGTGHNSIVKIPGRDEWYIVYHRINSHYLNNGPGIHREVCIQRLYFNEDGTIQQVTPTRRGINPVSLTEQTSEVVLPPEFVNIKKKNPDHREIIKSQVFNLSGIYVGNEITGLEAGMYIILNIYSDGMIKTEKMVKIRNY